MKIAWSGQHTRTKALPILIKALALMKSRVLANEILQVSLDVLGAGGETKKWKRLAESLGVSELITWHGLLPKDAAVGIVASADAFAITSLKDLTSTVTLEALSCGKPVVCVDHCGFSDVVDETCGIKIPVGRPKDVIEGFANAICRLKDDDALRARLARGAKEKAKQYSWSEKGNALKDIYGGGGKKVLASVYACSPYSGSEPGMGWHFLKAIAEDNEVWAIVEEEKWRPAIEKYLAAHPAEMQNVHWTFIHKPRARLLRKIWPPSYYWFYRIWQWRAYKKARDLSRVVKFDVMHQINMVGFRECGYLWKIDGPKFVWGPFGGLGYTDLRLLPLAGFVGAAELLARNFMNYLHMHFLLRPRHAARRAASTSSLIAATAGNREYAKKVWGVNPCVMCEVGV